MSVNKTTGSAVHESMGEPLSVQIREYWGTILRRKWLVLGSIVAGIAIAAMLCVVLPRSYRSNTLILIENQKIPEDYVKGIGGANVEQRLTMIQQQVMSRTILSQILDEYNLYERQVEREGIESAIETFRKMIKVETVGTLGSSGKSVEAVTLSFAHEDPRTAMKVTAKLASLFIEENVNVREQLVTGVSVFLEQELFEAKKALEAQEEAISKYKSKHMGQLPEQMETNLRTLDRLQMELTSTDDLLHGQTDRLSRVETLIKEYEVSGGTGANSDNPKTVNTAMDPLAVRLQELERRLISLRAEWKETYPDIADTKQEIEDVKAQLAEKYSAQTTDKDGESARTYNPSKTFDPYLRELLKQQNDLRADLSAIRDRRTRLVEQIKDTDRRVELIPSREQELMILVRDYENRKKNYQALLDKRLNARVAENLEKRQQGEQFRVLDEANLPQKPEKPNRLVIMILGLVGGCGLGVGLAIGLDLLNPTFRRREEVEILPGIHVLATVPQFFTLSLQISALSKVGPRVTGDDNPAVPAVKIAENGMHWASSGNRNEITSAIMDLVAKWQPRSIAAEQYRMAATKLVLSTEGRQSTVVEITSALMGEGKTTTVVNLGYTIARDFKKKTLLIDCDFQRPALHHYAGVPMRAGLIECLEAQASLEDCVSAIDDYPCFILAAGGAGGECNELERIQQLRGMLPELRAKFQYLIINTPPVLSSATMGILASLADELVLVIRAGHSPKHLVQKAFTMLGLTEQRQVILNGLDARSMPNHLYGYTMPYDQDRPIESVRR
ncbi:MAG: AAA family ATPase [Nitrospira sp.]|nr:AAA family ATPase [Nitrospira sp.]